MWFTGFRLDAMVASKTLMTILAVLLVAGGGVAATGLAQTDAETSTATVSDLGMDAALDKGTVTVTATDGGTPLENASITVEGDKEVRVTTDSDGTATVNKSVLIEDDESLEELEIEYESDHAEGELEFVVQDGSLTLVEEEYEYEVEESEEGDEEDEEDEEADDEESEEVDDDEEDGEVEAENDADN